MKYLFILTIAIAGLFSCSSTKQVSDIQVVESNENSIALNIKGQKPDYTAIYHLLFRGFPNSSQVAPLISTSEAIVIQQHPDYFKKLFDENRYKSFISSSSKNSSGTHHVVINLRALRLDLEQNLIIRKFGY